MSGKPPKSALFLNRIALLSPEGEIRRGSKKGRDEPPDEDALDDPDGGINRTQAFKFRFQRVLALAALSRIRFGSSPAAWAAQCFSHSLARTFLRWPCGILLSEELIQVLKIEDDNGPVAFEREELSCGIDQVSLPAD